MYIHSTYDLEMHARTVRERAESAATHRALLAALHTAPAADPTLDTGSPAWRRGLGRALIAAGNRLADPARAHPSAPCQPA